MMQKDAIAARFVETGVAVRRKTFTGKYELEYLCRTERISSCRRKIVPCDEKERIHAKI